MSVVISDVEYSPSPETGADGAAAPAQQQTHAIGSDEILAMLRREHHRRARLWAD